MNLDIQQKLKILSKELEALHVLLTYLCNELCDKLDEGAGEETREALEEAHRELDEATDLMARTLELLSEAEAEGGRHEAGSAPTLNMDQASLLLDDVLQLLYMEDMEGALVSLDRLIALSGPPGSLILQDNRRWLSKTAMLDYYLLSYGLHGGTRPRWGESTEEVPDFRILCFYPRVHAVISLIDGQLCIEEIARLANLSLLETIAVVSLLRRKKIVCIS